MGKIHKALEKSKREQKKSSEGMGFNKTIKRDLIEPNALVVNRELKQKVNENTQEFSLRKIHGVLEDRFDIEPKEASVLRDKIDSLKAPSRTPVDNSDAQDDFVTIQTGDNLEQEKKESESKKVVTIKTKAPEAKINEPETEDIEKQFGAKINAERARLDQSLVTLLKPRSFESEQFKLLRTNLIFPESGNPPRTVLITSALPGDGKSFVSSNLAISLALGLGQHVLLLDSDIRHPEIHKRFGYDQNVSGLSEYLAAGKPLSMLLLKTPVEKLKILPGGHPPDNPAELISSTKMLKLLEELEARYNDRCIIIDAPPPRLAAEARALARSVDCVLLVIRAGKTKREEIQETISLVGKDKIKGIIFNSYDPRSKLYGNYKKYGKYYQE